jgi:hypothetical protein
VGAAVGKRVAAGVSVGAGAGVGGVGRQAASKIAKTNQRAKYLRFFTDYISCFLVLSS